MSNTPVKSKIEVHRVNAPKSSFVRIRNDVFTSGLSGNAIKLLGYLLSHQNGYSFYWKDVEAHDCLGMNPRTRSGALDALIDAGYARLDKNKLTVSDIPIGAAVSASSGMSDEVKSRLEDLDITVGDQQNGRKYHQENAESATLVVAESAKRDKTSSYKTTNKTANYIPPENLGECENVPREASRAAAKTTKPTLAPLDPRNVVNGFHKSAAERYDLDVWEVFNKFCWHHQYARSRDWGAKFGKFIEAYSDCTEEDKFKVPMDEFDPSHNYAADLIERLQPTPSR